MNDLLTIDEIEDNPTFVFYEKRIPHKESITIKSLDGLATTTNRVIHKNIGLNQFLWETTDIPQGYRKKKSPSKDWVKKYFYDPSRTPIRPKEVPELKADYTRYSILDNGGTPFFVYISPDEKDVAVYTIPGEEYIPEYYEEQTDIRYYTKRVLKIKPTKVFIGKSPENSMTRFSGGIGKGFDGNTILLHDKGRKYIFISGDIEFFETEYPIVKFVSPVGNSSVPYPFAVDTHKNYYLLGFGKIIFNVPENMVMKCDLCGDECNELVKDDPNRYYYDLDKDKMEEIEIVRRIPTEAY